MHLKDAVTNSPRYGLVYSPTSKSAAGSEVTNWHLSIVSLDPHRHDSLANESTVMSVVLLIGAYSMMDQEVVSCGSSNAESCAANILAWADADIGKLSQ